MTNLDNELQNFRQKIQTANQLIDELEKSNKHIAQEIKRLNDIDSLVKTVETNSVSLIETIENRYISLTQETKAETNLKIVEIKNLIEDIDSKSKQLNLSVETTNKSTTTYIEQSYKKLIADTNEAFVKSTIGLEKEVNFTRETLRNLVSLYESSNRNILQLQPKLDEHHNIINLRIEKTDKKLTSFLILIGIINVIVLALSVLNYLK